MRNDKEAIKNFGYVTTLIGIMIVFLISKHYNFSILDFTAVFSAIAFVFAGGYSSGILRNYKAETENKKFKSFIEQSLCDCYDEYGSLRPIRCDRCKILGHSDERIKK